MTAVESLAIAATARATHAGPADVAAVLRQFPAQHVTIMGWLHTHHGNAYVQRVIAQGAAGRPAWTVVATPRKATFLPTEIGAVSPPCTIQLANHGGQPIDITSLELIPHGDGAQRAHPGEFELIISGGRHLRPFEMLTVEVVFRPQRVVPYIKAHLRAKGTTADAHLDVALEAVPAAPRPEHADQRELSVAKHDARILELTATPSVQHYGDMLAAVLAAQSITDRAPDDAETHARIKQLLDPVIVRLDQLNDHQGHLASFGAGNIAGQVALDMSEAAVRSWLRRLALGARINTDELVTKFRVGAEPIRFLTGERSDAPTLVAFDHATRLTGIGAAAALLAPALLAVAAEEAVVLAFVGRVAGHRIALWALTNPAAAVATSEALLGFGLQIGDDGWETFWDQLCTPEGRLFVLAQVLMDFMHVKSGMSGSGDAGEPPSGRQSGTIGQGPSPQSTSVPDLDGARQRLTKVRTILQQVSDGAAPGELDAARRDNVHTTARQAPPQQISNISDTRSSPGEATQAHADDAPLVRSNAAKVTASEHDPLDAGKTTTAGATRDLGLSPDATNALRSLEYVKADPVGDINSQPNHNHYQAARRESSGQVVARRPQDGRPYSHIGDLQRGYDALARIRATLQREIATPPRTLSTRGLETLLAKEAEVARLLNRLGGFLNEIGQGQFPPYHVFPPGA